MTQTDSFLKSHTVSKIEEEITFKIYLSPILRRDEGNRELSFPGLQISVFLFCCFCHLQWGAGGKMEKLKSRMGHLRIPKILRKKRGNNCNTAVLKEETWTHKQKNLDPH